MSKEKNNISGTFRVSTDVINSIAEAAAAEIDGVVVSAPNKLAVLVNSPIAAKFCQPVKVKFGSECAVLDVSVITESGYKAYDIAKSVQENVKSSVQNMTGIAVSKVNVKIVAIKSK